MSGYASRFIDMYSISFIDNTLLNKLMAKVLVRIYEIFFTCFLQQREQNIKEYTGGSKKFSPNLKFYKDEIEERKLFKAKVEEIRDKIRIGGRNFFLFYYLFGFIYGIDVAY